MITAVEHMEQKQTTQEVCNCSKSRSDKQVEKNLNGIEKPMYNDTNQKRPTEAHEESEGGTRSS